MKSVVRLASLQIKNIKNVKSGQIVMPDACKKPLTYEEAQILGLYGQNGSGKTAVMDALYFLQCILSGRPLEEELADYISADEQQGQIAADFHIFTASAKYETGYRITIERRGKGTKIARETLSCAVNRNGSRTRKTVCMDFKQPDKTDTFSPKIRADEVIAETPGKKNDLIVARKMAEKVNCSYIFGECGRELFCRNYENDFKQVSEILQSLYAFAEKDLFVLRHKPRGRDTANSFLPEAKREQTNIDWKGDFPYSFVKPLLLSREQEDQLETMIERINPVFTAIIPGRKIEIIHHGEQLMDSGENGLCVELASKRENSPAIPLRMESQGILKILSILQVLIPAFADPSVCAAVDDLDTGIYEYMLGELLDIFNESAKGQLLFTSHNLRPLEMLGKDNMMLSTANPQKKYIKLKRVRPANTLRDAYLRSITLGGQEEALCEETDSLKIARAFRKACSKEN